MLEAGSLSSAEYEAQVRARRDFQRLQRRDSEGDRQVWLPGVLAWPLVPLLAVLVQEEKASRLTLGWAGGFCSQQELSVAATTLPED